MADRFTTTSKNSNNPLVAMLLGIALFIGSFFLIFWNEKNYIIEMEEIEFVRSAVVSLPSSQPDPTNNEKLVHLSEVMITDEVLSDTMFGISENALKLSRTVEMYQWQERTHKQSNNDNTTTTTYEYNLGWHSNLISHSNFKHPEGHENPTSMPYQSKVYTAKNMTMGGFNISQQYYEQIENLDTYELTQQNLDASDPKIKSSYKLSDNQYANADLNNPKLGDIKISFTIVKPMMMSIIGKQDGNAITPYQKDGREIAFLYPDKQSAQEILNIEESNDATQAWMFRGLAFLMMWGGLNFFLSPLVMLASFIPFLGRMVEYVTGMFTLLISAPLYIITIAIAWLALRPFEASIAIIVAAAIFYFGFNIMKASKIAKAENVQKNTDSDESEDIADNANKKDKQDTVKPNTLGDISNKTPKDGDFL